jgi:hypothetical protein
MNNPTPTTTLVSDEGLTRRDCTVDEINLFRTK